MVALETRCVFLAIVTNLILAKTSREPRDDDISQEEDGLRQALTLVNMLRTDYLKVLREKQVLSDTLAILTQHLPSIAQQLASPSIPSPSPTSVSVQPTTFGSVSTSVSTENWFNSSSTAAAPNSSFSSTTSTTASSLPQTSTLTDIPQRRFMVDQAIMKNESSTLSTKKEVVIPLKKVAARNPEEPVERKREKQITQQFVRTSAQKTRKPVTHSIARKPARQQQAARKSEKKDFWRHLRTPPRKETQSRDPMVEQIARELINEFQHGNTKSLNMLKNKILMSRGLKNLREGDEGENNNGDAVNPENNEGNKEEGTIANGEENVKPETNEANANEANVNGEHDKTEPIAGDVANNENTSGAQIEVTGNLTAHYTNNASSASTTNLLNLWPTTRPKPTYKGTLKLYLARSSRLPTPLPKNNAYCFWEPKSPLCGLSI